MVTREDIISAYRLLLNREPESEAAIEGHMYIDNWQQLRHIFMASPEYRYSSGYLDRWMVAPIFGDTMLLWVNMKDKYCSIHCVMDAYEPDSSNVVRQLLRRGDTFLDIGANIGWFTMLASSIVGETGYVHSFEPQPIIARYLRRSIDLNGLAARVRLHEVGVWHHHGSMSLGWHEDAENHGASYLMPEGAESSAGSNVELLTLDSLNLDRVDMIKIDVEGAEAKAMQGAERLLARHRPIILSELHAVQLPVVSAVNCSEYVQQMEQRGYRCLGLRGEEAGRFLSSATISVQGFTDVLFVPEEKTERALHDLFPQPPNA